MSENSSTIFFDSWHTYQKVVAANYMFHREFAAQLSQFLNARFGAEPFLFLDLGCGDAATLAHVLEGCRIKSYKGVDLSEPALALAVKNLGVLSCPVDLVRNDISAALSGETNVYDVIYSSFALHHLPLEAKAEFFRRAARCVKKGGFLLLVDVMREEEETLEVFYRHYCSWLRGSFTALDPQELDRVCDHIVNNDLPEPVSVLQGQAGAAGLGNMEQIGSYDWHHFLSFTRN